VEVDPRSCDVSACGRKHDRSRQPCSKTLEERESAAAASVDREPGNTSGYLQDIGDLFTALRRQGLIAHELVLQLTTFLRSLDLLLELIVLTPRALTANQVRHGGKQGTDNSERSRIHFSAWPALTSLLRSLRPKD
jgi:hypothetical protein